MPSVINTNLASLNTQRNLASSQAALGVSIHASVLRRLEGTEVEMVETAEEPARSR